MKVLRVTKSSPQSQEVGTDLWTLLTFSPIHELLTKLN